MTELVDTGAMIDGVLVVPLARIPDERGTIDLSRETGRRVLGYGAPEDLDRAKPNDVLVQAWHLAAKIHLESREIEVRGGRFVVAIPELSVVSDDGRQPVSVS
jgi:hypothetical protein